MAISYPNVQSGGGGSTTTNPYAFELITSNQLPLTISGTTSQEAVFKFFLPPEILYKTQNNQYSLGIVSYLTGSSSNLTASFKFEAGDPYYSTTYHNSFSYTRFADTGSNLLTVDLNQVGPTGFAIPLYISGTSDFTASVYKIFLSPI